MGTDVGMRRIGGCEERGLERIDENRIEKQKKKKDEMRISRSGPLDSEKEKNVLFLGISIQDLFPRCVVSFPGLLPSYLVPLL